MPGRHVSPRLEPRTTRLSFFVIHKASTAVSMGTGQVAEHNEGPRRAKNNADLGTYG
jgi:hypothetical protein